MPNFIYKESGPLQSQHKAAAMLRIYIISLSVSLVIQATLIPSLPTLSADQIAKQDILQTQTFPHYNWSPLTMLSPTLTHSLAGHGTEKDYSLQVGMEKRPASEDVLLEWFVEKSGKMGWRNEDEREKNNINFREFWGNQIKELQG